MAKEQFTEKEEGWILPRENTTWGTKARNLYDNREIIKRNGLFIPKSMIIPYEYFQMEGGIYYLLDAIQEYFPNNPAVAIRSNSPDEDNFGRTPGFYCSREIYHEDRRNSLWAIEAVASSYHSPKAIERRRRLNLEEKGMSLLVQEKISGLAYTGSFGDWGEKGLLTFTDHSAGLDSMQKPSHRTFYIDNSGRITDAEKSFTTYDSEYGATCKNLTDSLPKMPNKGWEIEFGVNTNGFYVFQTTPIEKKERFKVNHTEDNIFRKIAVLGTGKFKTDKFLWVPHIIGRDSKHRKTLQEFDRENQDYCLITPHKNFHYEIRLLDDIQNAKIVIDICEGFWAGHPFAPHVEQYMRENRTAIAGQFLGKLNNTFPTGSRALIRYPRTPLLESETEIEIQSDEIEQQNNVRIIGKLKSFKPVGRI